MNLLLNIIWIIFGGLEMAIGWLIAAFFFAISIVGIPWARAAFNMAEFHLWPFGRTIVDRENVTGREDLGTGGLGMLGNIIWFVLAGWWLALGHLFFAALLTVTVIGIHFAWQHLKLAGMAVAPIGKMVIAKHDAQSGRLSHQRP